MKKVNIALLLVVLAAAVVISCSKPDDYKKYLENGETSYTGKLDSVKIYSGRLRVKINGLLPADPKITKTKITWNSGNDSMVYAITKGTGIDTFSKIINVPEGVSNFTIQNYDAVGNQSLPVIATGIAYGPKYESGLISRTVAAAETQPSGITVITWEAFDTSTGAKGVWIRYTKTNNTIDSVYAPVRETTTNIAGLKTGTSISYRTSYLPTPVTFDTFYSAVQTKSVKADVTTVYLSNTGPNFARAAFDGRFGTLAAPWITNTAAKNKGGMYGGYVADNGGTINWETWNNTPVVDGIVYQPTSTALPAGTYTVSFDEYSEIQANSTVYCVAAAGGNGIPVLANLSTALGSAGLYNGAVTGTTSPSATDTRSFNFTITTPQVVSIGFLGNIVGNGNPGSYFRVSKIQLIKN